MKGTWKGLMAGAGAAGAALVLGATVLVSTVGGQSPAPAMPGTPPNRVFGTVQLNGQTAPAGTAIVALIGMTSCGTAQVSTTGTYVIDVLSAASMPGCGTDGATVAFTVGGARATQTTMWQQGRFTDLPLTAQAQTPTATARPPTATPTRAPVTATPTRAPVTATPTVRPATPTPTARPAVSPTARPQGPATGPAAQRPAAAAPAAARPAGQAPAALPRTGTGMAADTGATTGVALAGLALAVLALGTTGLLAYRRSR